MKYEYYIISFQNIKTGEFKEYYEFKSPEDIEQIARDLRNKFFNKEDVINIHIYKQVKMIYDGE